MGRWEGGLEVAGWVEDSYISELQVMDDGILRDIKVVRMDYL